MSPSERVPSAPNAEDKADAVVRRELAAAAASCLRRCSAALGPAALGDLALADAGALQLPQHSHDDADAAACAEADRTVMCAAAALAAVSMQFVIIYVVAAASQDVLTVLFLRWFVITLSSTQVASSSPSCCDAVCNKILPRVLSALGGSLLQSPADVSRSSLQPPGDTCLRALQVLVQLLDGVAAAAAVTHSPSGENNAAGGVSGGGAVSAAWSGCSLVQALPSLAEAVADAGKTLESFTTKSAMDGLGRAMGNESQLLITHSELKLLFCRFWGSLAGLTVAVQLPQRLREGVSPPPPLLTRAGPLHDAARQLLRWSLASPLTMPLGEPGSGSGSSGDLAPVPVPSDLVTSRMDWGRKHPLQHSAATAVVALMTGPAADLGGCLRVEDIVLGEILTALMTSSLDGGRSLNDDGSSRAASEGLCGIAADPTAVVPMDVDDAENGDGQQASGRGSVGAAIHRRQQVLSVAAFISRQGPPAFAWQLASRWREAVMAGLQATQAGAGQKQVSVMAGPREAQVCVCAGCSLFLLSVTAMPKSLFP